MQVKVLRGFCIGDGKDVYPGELVDLSDRDAVIKMRQGKVCDVTVKENSRAARQAQKAAEKGGPNNA